MTSRLPSRLAPLLAATLVIVATAAPAGAAGTDEARRYQHCLELVQTDPVAAQVEARTWHGAGGGRPARHCRGLALIAAGKPAEGANRLEELAAEMEEEKPRLRADLLHQIGQAWFMAGQAERAAAALSAGLALAPDDVEMLIDRALALGGTARYWEAIDDLNKALDLDADRADALTYRAAAYRFVEAFELAATDVERALALAPDYPEALFERGIIRRLSGDAAGARADWLRILQLAPAAPIAEAARINIEKLDVSTK